MRKDETRRFDVVFVLPGKESHIGTTYGQVSEILKQYKDCNKLLVYDSENSCASSVVENLDPIIRDETFHLVAHNIPADAWFKNIADKKSKIINFRLINKAVPESGILILLCDIKTVLIYAALAYFEWNEIEFLEKTCILASGAKFIIESVHKKVH